MAIDEIIFLGAGASAADGAPTQNELFKSYFEHRPHKDTIDANLSQFFKDFFGIDTQGVIWIVLTFQPLKKCLVS